MGVVGVGRVGREHARILSALPGAELTGIHDADPDRGRAVGREFGVPHRPDLESLLEAVDAVVVAVPTRHHHAVALTALRSGRHVLVEKPVTRTLAEADDLIETAEEEGLTLGVGHVERFNGAIRSSEPYLERPRFIESHRLAPFQPRGTDVNVVLDLMIHDIDLVLGLVGSPLESLHAVGTPVLTDRVDIANARLVFRDGAVAEITASRVSEERSRMLRIFQRSGYIRLDLAREEGEFLRRSHPGTTDGGDPASGVPESLDELVERRPLWGDGREPLLLELRSFLDSVRGRDSRLVSAREARDALEIALHISEEIERYADVTVEAS